MTAVSVFQEVGNSSVVDLNIIVKISKAKW